MKGNYLKDLKNYLESKNINKQQIAEVVLEYNILYEESKDLGFSHEEIIKKLGTSKEIYNSLKEDLDKDITYIRRNKITGLMVFISLILFFVVGNVFDVYEYSWLFFLLIPLTPLVLLNRIKETLPGIMVFVSLIVFFILGFSFNLWHPGWLVFLSIPVSAILFNKVKFKVVSLMPFLTLIVYFVVSYFYNDFYLYGWPVFLLIPLVGVVRIKDNFKRIIMFLTLSLSIIIYYVLAIYYNNWAYPLFVFIIPFIYGFYIKYIKLEIQLMDDPLLLFLMGVVLISYLVTSLLTSGWAWTWMILLLIPIFGIYSETKFKSVVAYMPFISLILFYSFGYFIDGGWTYSWLFFLMIPMAGIIFETKVKINKNDNDLDKN